MRVILFDVHVFRSVARPNFITSSVNLVFISAVFVYLYNPHICNTH